MGSIFYCVIISGLFIILTETSFHLSYITSQNVTLYLYTQETIETPEELSVGDLYDLYISNFHPSRINYFIIHGIFSNYTYGLNVKDAILRQSDVNLFLVDYSGPASIFEIHDEAIVTTGKFVAEFIEMMKIAYNIFAENFVLVGFSMGAHVAGEIGRNLGGEIGTIIALDAANMTPPIVYIDTEKAYYVQSVHTSTIGLTTPVGHASYFVNTVDQPGCNGDIGCSHERAVKYYEESLVYGGFTALKCDDFNSYISGLCINDEFSYLGGLEIDKSAFGSYFLLTFDESPFSIG